MSKLVDKCVCQLQAPAGLRPTPEHLVGPPTRQIRPWLTNLWHAGPKRHAEIFPWYATFRAVTIFFLHILPQKSLYIVKNMCVCVCIYIYIHAGPSGRAV